MNEVQNNRDLSTDERDLVQWMLEHGSPEATQFLSQLVVALVTPWHCGCGCASFNLFVPGYPVPSGGLHPIANFVFGAEADLAGIFVFERGGTLAGVEVYGLAGDAPSVLPTPDLLRPFFTSPANA